MILCPTVRKYRIVRIIAATYGTTGGAVSKVSSITLIIDILRLRVQLCHLNNTDITYIILHYIAIMSFMKG